MTPKWFISLLRAFGIDIRVRDRAEWRELYKLSAFQEIFETFEKNCQGYYFLGEYITVDEKIVIFGGRYPFRQYIPSKPA